MAAQCASWAAGQHMNTLTGLATKLERLERQAELLETWQDDSDKLNMLKAYRGGQVMTQKVSELKSFIQAVADAELDGNEILVGLTASHTARYAAGLIKQLAEQTGLPSKCNQVIADLASATLCMLSQRTGSHELLTSGGAIPALLLLLDPMQSPCAVDNAAKALGNLSADVAARAVVRSSGGVGALVRMLKSDCPGVMQASAAASLALLSARDSVVQDSLRYLGGIQLLVDMLNSTQHNVTEAARCCLCALKHNNSRNASEILSALRSSTQLAKDYWRLKDALRLLDEAPLSGLTSSLTGSLMNATKQGPGSLAAHAAATTQQAKHAASSKSKFVADLLVEHAVDEASLEVAAAAAQVADAVEEEVLRRKIERAERPLEALSSNLQASVALLKASMADSKTAAARRAAAATLTRSSGSISATSRPVSAPVRPSYSRNPVSCPECPSTRSAMGKHIMRYNTEEVVALLQELGMEDVFPLKRAGVSGAELLSLDEDTLVALTGIARHRAHRIKRLQDAMKLYDAIATRVCQSRLTDVELRLWLAAQGCSSSEASRVMKLLRSLVMSDQEAPFISAWDWAVGWTWVMHALEVYGLDWRV
eukprot:gene9012-9185_t